MELTGQAYEEKQEQNIRLVQQLKEKDDANFKLMSEVSREGSLLAVGDRGTNQLSEILRALSASIL